MTRLWPILMSVAPLAACGYSGGGGGTNNLEVIATITYYANDDRSEAVVQVLDANQNPVTNARVELTDGDGSGTKIEMGPTDDTTGRSRGEIDGFLRRIEIDVDAGGPRLAGHLEAPAPHTVLRPKDDGDRKISKDLAIAWATTDGIRADQVVIELSQAQFTTVLIDDGGAYTIPNFFLRVGAENLAIRRQNSIVLAGGIRASSLTAGYQVNTDLTILAE